MGNVGVHHARSGRETSVRAAEREDEVKGTASLGSTVERGLLNSAIDFYGAAGAVLDYAGAGRPRLRYDVAGLQAVRAAMGALEQRICVARRAGMPADQIVRITRLEPELVELILQRQLDAEPAAEE
jgi:hypothetical protein